MMTLCLKPFLKRLVVIVAYRFGILPRLHWRYTDAKGHADWLRKNRHMDIGADTRINPDAHLMDWWKLKIGSGCAISFCTFVTHDALDHSHPWRCDGGQRRDHPVTVVEDGVLIGCGAIIFPGVRIGRGSIVGAGCVVTSDVPPWTQLRAPQPEATPMRERGTLADNLRTGRSAEFYANAQSASGGLNIWAA